MKTKKELIEFAKSCNAKVFKSWTLEKIRCEIAKSLKKDFGNAELVACHHEKFSRSYFWSPPTHASSRRKMEENENFEVEIELDGDKYHFISSVNCSCKNVYYASGFYVNGEKKNFRSWRKLQEKIQQKIQELSE